MTVGNKSWLDNINLNYLSLAYSHNTLGAFYVGLDGVNWVVNVVLSEALTSADGSNPELVISDMNRFGVVMCGVM